MNDTDTEAQIERAIKTLPYANGQEDIARAMRRLIAGEFKEPELPAIAAPPWPHTALDVYEHRSSINGWYVGTDCSLLGISSWQGDLNGPSKPTKREAIEAWNAVFAPRNQVRP